MQKSEIVPTPKFKLPHDDQQSLPPPTVRTLSSKPTPKTVANNTHDEKNSKNIPPNNNQTCIVDEIVLDGKKYQISLSIQRIHEAIKANKLDY